MIEDKKLGLKVAENEEEDIWATAKANTEKRIKEYEINLMIERELLKLFAKKLKGSKDGGLRFDRSLSYPPPLP